MTNTFETYHLTGLAVVNDPDACSFLAPLIPELSWDRHWDGTLQVVEEQQIQEALEKTRDYIFEKLKPYFVDVSLEKMELHNSIDTGTYKWHNDGNEGHNATIVLHFNSMTVAIGGEIRVRNNVTDTEYAHFPQRGDIIVFSQKPEFDHQVGKLNFPHDRIGAFFDCILKP